MFSEHIVYKTAQQLMCACTTAVGRLHISCCATVVQLMCGIFLQVIELGECLDGVFVVYDATCLSATVHGEDGVTHIHSLQWDAGGKDISQSASTCHIAVVDESLARNTSLLADSSEDGC